ncbi:DUF1609 domain-containing protein [Encephalitozoon intestinalis]
MMGLSQDETEPLFHYISHEILVNTPEKFRKEVVGELIQLALLKNEEIPPEHANMIIEEVIKRKNDEMKEEARKIKKQEEERHRYEEELIREEEKEKREYLRSKKEVKKVKKNNKTKKEVKKEQAEEEVLEGASNYAKNKDRSVVHFYKIHKRVFRWMMDTQNIKRELDAGSEEKWKKRSIKDIKKQKVVHDIIEVTKILKKDYSDKFFIDTESYLKNGSKRRGKIAVGMLENEGSKKLGIVEVGIFEDRNGRDVIYHLMFKSINSENIEKVVNSALEKMDSIDEINILDDPSNLKGFNYSKNIRSETIEKEKHIKIVWRDPKEISIIIKSLTIFHKPFGIQ